jgi:hypothetical protein
MRPVGLLLVSGFMLVSLTSAPASAQCRSCGICAGRCNVCPGGISGELFGYYPTIWRPWPGVIVTPVTEAIPAPAPSAVPTPSPAPMPPGPKQPAPAPKALEAPPKTSEKPLEPTSFPTLEQTGYHTLEQSKSGSEPQPYYAPPQ